MSNRLIREIRHQSRPGLDNAGNSSYLNASLQGLFACEGFRMAVIIESADKTDLDCNKCLCDLFINMAIGTEPFYSANQLRDLLSLETDTEHDPLDLIWVLCDVLYRSSEESGNEDEERLHVTDSLGGVYNIALTCENNHQKQIMDCFYVATLYVPRNANAPIPLQQLIDMSANYGTRYEMSCETCQSSEVIAKMSFDFIGDYLILHLKHMEVMFDWKESDVAIQHTITVLNEEYTIVACICFDENNQSDCVYYCYAKIGRKTWYLFRDRDVSEATTSAMPEQKDLKNAYILFYQKASIASSYDNIDALLRKKSGHRLPERSRKSGKGTNLEPAPAPEPAPATLPGPNLTLGTHTVGLQNLGNTCYMNAILQSLFHCEEFRTVILTGPQDRRFHGLLTQLFLELEFTDQQYIAARNFVENFIANFPEFTFGAQHDCQEFLSHLIEILFDESKTVAAIAPNIEPQTPEQAWQQFLDHTNNSYLVHIFAYQTEYQNRCLMCQHSWNTYVHPWLCLLVLPTEETFDVQACILQALRPEFVADARCRGCSYVGLHKTLVFTRLPRVLIIQMNIYTYDHQTGQPCKLNYNLVINEHIEVNNQRFRCFASVIHVGRNALCGHYTAYCKRGDRWYYFDDSIVTQIEPDPQRLTNSYILFYERITAQN